MSDKMQLSKRESQEAQPIEQVRSSQTYLPNVDIIEKDDELLLVADMPGVKANDVDIRYERGELTLLGKVEPRQSPDATNFLLREYGIGDYHRVFRVGDAIAADRIEAEQKDGVLIVHLPKTEEAAPRKISVKAG